METWKQVPEWPDYLVSSFGRVKSIKNGRERILNPFRNENSYRRVLLRQDGKQVSIALHKLIAQVFLGRHDHLEVNHKDGNKENCRVDNLEWVTHAENMEHAGANLYAHRSFRILGTSTKDRAITIEFRSINSAKKSGMSGSGITRCLSGKFPTATSNGYTWERKHG